jgi:hypothetical protein
LLFRGFALEAESNKRGIFVNYGQEQARRRAPNLRALDRLIAGFCSLWIKPSRFFRVATAFKPSTLLTFHRALVQRKYRLIFSRKQKTTPGPKGPMTADLIRAVVEMKQRNPT